MSKTLRIVIAQLNLTIGDISGNLEKHLRAAFTARDNHAADIIVFPELSLTAYPPEDLLLRKAFIQEANEALKKFTADIQNIYCLIGHPLSNEHHLFNAASLILNGKVIASYAKQSLPNYGIFDESRYFTPGTQPCVVSIKDIPIGIVICEDLWRTGPVQQAAEHGAKLILSPNASPFETDKHERRMDLLNKRATQHHVPIVYVNHVGGQDDLVFDGGSMVVDASGNLCQSAGFFHETLLPVEINMDSVTPFKQAAVTIPSEIERTYQALVLSVRDYINKNHFPGVLIGLSGGIDSALALAIAVDAIGKDRVKAIMMPSQYTADISMKDAARLAANLNVKTETLSIESVFDCFVKSLSPVFAGKKPDVTEENIQARCRATMLMALSNKTGWLVMTTGNRSELAVGYCTLYGDMAGGFAVLKDVPKTLVYQLAAWRNLQDAVISQSILEREPTAELAPDQKDQDTLPPYPVLDKILMCYLDHSMGIEEIANEGIAQETVINIINMIHKNEHKRRQAPIGPHINHKSFGRDWRYPVTNAFKG